ncbi:hypothetical protein [Pseudoalteromonas sp. ND6B]|uniref:hypothetical protein n=1 Tax=Pseudoalteromonas sp. ND6B TaxID=1535421 RepID=UPI000519FE55|nr:hypothetical protein [Pseudoalteromonas sp. ND6B]KGK01932.1 hypothetical protein ND6B_1371 [Pseudoalteromonas sp. ND6B]
MKYITIFLVLLLVGCNSTDKTANSSIVYTNTQTDSPAKWVVGLRALKLWRFKLALLNGRLVKAEYAGTLEWRL